MKTEGATLNGFLDRGSHLTGDLKFDDGFRIDGKFEGKITSGSDLVIGENADVEAEIKVERLTVNGSLRGNVTATERIELHPKARVLADLTTPNLAIQEGAFFQGSCKMGQETPSNVIGMPSSVAAEKHS
ncbi:MAG TPA: polymer-forming cytoskeletal protein [Thermoanaerobaculia bacterium]|nr:polymer-forming cytoskeletal protein [Thermoanaerobaculia bacterium]